MVQFSYTVVLWSSSTGWHAAAETVMLICLAEGLGLAYILKSFLELTHAHHWLHHLNAIFYSNSWETVWMLCCKSCERVREMWEKVDGEGLGEVGSLLTLPDCSWRNGISRLNRVLIFKLQLTCKSSDRQISTTEFSRHYFLSIQNAPLFNGSGKW